MFTLHILFEFIHFHVLCFSNILPFLISDTSPFFWATSICFR